MITRRYFLTGTVSLASLPLIPKLLTNSEIQSQESFYMKVYKHNQFVARKPLIVGKLDPEKQTAELHYAQKGAKIIDFNKVEVYKNNILISKFNEQLVMMPNDTLSITLKIRI